MRLEEYLNTLVWTQTDLARKAGIAVITATHAIDGRNVKRDIAVKIANALSEALGEKVEVRDIEGLNVRPLRYGKKQEKG